jgi:manganese/zinc/iron transport system permease protein
VSYLTGIALLAVVTAVTCSLPGVFLVLRKNAMMTEAVSHAILPGIVLGLVVTGTLDSPLLIVAASLTGLVVVIGTEYLQRTGLLEGDAPQGLIFPALFGLGVIMISLQFANVHLDEHVVLAGDLNIAGFVHLRIGDVSIGPRYLYVMIGVLAMNIAFLILFYKELKISTFDPALADMLGFKTRRIHYLFMFLTSITITASFYAAGSILTVALMVAPAATAYLITRRLKYTIWVTVVIAVVTSLAGFFVAYVLDAATSGGMAFFCGLAFVLAFVVELIRRSKRIRVLRAQSR